MIYDEWQRMEVQLQYFTLYNVIVHSLYIESQILDRKHKTAQRKAVLYIIISMYAAENLSLCSYYSHVL